MLRMFSKRESNNSITVSSKHQSRSGVCTDEDLPTTEFPALVLQLAVAEEKLKCASSLLVKHSNALAELLQTTTDIRALTSKQFPSRDGASNTALAREQKALAESVAKFRTTAIAPLHALLSSFPQLKHRIDHRKSALGTWRRYQKKIDDMDSKGDSNARLHRNRLKCMAAQERFQQLDKDVQREMMHILSLDLGMLIDVPMLQLVDAQQGWAATLQTSAAHLRSSIACAPPPALPTPPPSPPRPLHPVQTQVSPTKQPLRSPSTSDEDNNIRLSFKHQHSSMGGEGSDEPAALIPIKLPPRMGCADAEDDVNVLDKSRSLRPKKPHAQGSRTWHMHQHAKQSLAQGLDVLDAVKLPPGFGREEWVAVHAQDFFNEVSLLYGTISELCTPTSCPEMSAGPCYTYLWADDHGGTPVPCSAPAYVTKLLMWIDSQLSDPAVFPDSGFESNRAFAVVSRNMFKRLFRVYAHIYHNHLPDFAALHAESHLKCSFKRFVSFVLEFDLVETKELNALRKLICDVVPGKM